jgi:hypothetical protein
MAAYTIKKFGGSTPRMADHLLGETTAGQALDCKLWHGTLDSWREPLQVHVSSNGTITTALYDCCWLDFETSVDLAYGPVSCKKLFSTGAEEWPAVHEFSDDCTPTTRRLGVPCAYAAPSIVAAVPAASKNIEGRSYAYQYRNAAMERGALSMGSVARLIADGQSVVVSGWAVPDPSWGVTHVRIYRAVSGHQTGREAGNVLDTVWMFVGEAAIGAPSYTDTKFNEDLIEALEEDVADPPPAELRGMIMIQSINALAGFVGKRVYFSENNSYHQWPYFIDLDDNVCALAESNGTIYAATDGAPYAITGDVDCANAGCRKAVRLPARYPMVGCGNRRMTAIPQGAVYPTHDGLVALNGGSVPSLLTQPLYAPDDWHKLYPESVIPVHFNGRLFVFARERSFVLTLANGPESSWPLDGHSELSDAGVTDAFVSRTGDFYIVKNHTVYQWDRGATLRPHHWTSPELVAPTMLNFGAGRLWHDHGEEQVKITVDGRVALDRGVLSSRVFRLPMWAEGSVWHVELQGTATVKLFSMATSMKELGA